MITIYLRKADIQTSALSYLLGRSVTCSSKGKTMDTVQLPITLISSSELDEVRCVFHLLLFIKQIHMKRGVPPSVIAINEKTNADKSL